MNKIIRVRIIICVAIVSIVLAVVIFMIGRVHDEEKSARLVRAIQLDEVDAIDSLLRDIGYDMNKQSRGAVGAEGPVGDTPFIAACRAGNVDVVDSYVMRGFAVCIFCE